MVVPKHIRVMFPRAMPDDPNPEDDYVIPDVSNLTAVERDYIDAICKAHGPPLDALFAR